MTIVPFLRVERRVSPSQRNMRPQAGSREESGGYLEGGEKAGEREGYGQALGLPQRHDFAVEGLRRRTGRRSEEAENDGEGEERRDRATIERNDWAAATDCLPRAV